MTAPTVADLSALGPVALLRYYELVRSRVRQAFAIQGREGSADERALAQAFVADTDEAMDLWRDRASGWNRDEDVPDEGEEAA